MVGILVVEHVHQGKDGSPLTDVCPSEQHSGSAEPGPDRIQSSRWKPRVTHAPDLAGMEVGTTASIAEAVEFNDRSWPWQPLVENLSAKSYFAELLRQAVLEPSRRMQENRSY
jgi:hypothetical protein